MAPSGPEALSGDEARAFHSNLPEWYRVHQRPLPWRTKRTPYRVWVAEIMLQQTRADQAAPYYRSFMRRFPSLRSLADAAPDAVLKAWEGLGYYRRAVRLHEGARYIRDAHGGRFPRTLEAIRALPGVGAYTAAAVGSLAFGLPEPVLDGNVIRVLSRVHALDSAPWTAVGRRRLERLARRLLPAGNAGAFNEALMELGALCCLPGNPLCRTCPLCQVCRAAARGKMRDYPRRRPPRHIPHYDVGAAVLLDRRGRILLAQRRPDDMLGGLWEFPGGKRKPGECLAACIRRELHEELGIRIEIGEKLITVRHAYSHFRITLTACLARLAAGRPKALQCAAWAWVVPEKLSAYPLSKADLRIRDAVLARFTPRPRKPRGARPARP